MADVRPPLDEALVREAHDDLMRGVQEQRRVMGVPVPDDKTAREFVDPILDKVLAEHEEERAKDLVRPAPVKKPAAPGWTGEAEHSPRVREIPGVRTEVINNPAGNAEWDLRTNLIRPPPGFLDDPRKKRKLGPAAEAAVKRFRFLMTMPEWAERCKKALETTFGLGREAREKALRAILADSVRVFGSPMQRKPRKIYVG